MKRRLLYGTTSLLLLGACNPATTVQNTLNTARPVAAQSDVLPEAFMSQQGTTLESWWSFFGDDVFDRLISSALSLNTQRVTHTYLDPKIDLISGVAHHYLEYRYVQNQRHLLNTYIDELDEVIKGMESDRERTKRKAEHDLLEDKAKQFLKREGALIAGMTSLTKLLPEFVEEILREAQDIPQADVTLLFASPARIMMNAPEVIQARMNFYMALPHSAPVDTKNILPDMTMSGFFGIPDDAYLTENASWRVVEGGSEQRVLLENLKSQYNNVPAYKAFETSISAYVTDVEKLITEFTHVQVQKNVLKKAAEKSEGGYKSSMQYTDKAKRNAAQGDAYKAQLAWLRAEYEASKMLVDLYKKIGVY